jgi:hypothetical protein
MSVTPRVASLHIDDGGGFRMTCSTCGNVLAQDARFCPRCGAPSSLQPQPGPAYVPISAGLRDYRVSRNLQTLGTLWLCYAALRALTGMVALPALGAFRSELRLESVRPDVDGEPLADRGILAHYERRLHRSDRVCAAHTPTLGAHTCHRLQHLRTVPLPSRHGAGNLHPVGAGAEDQRR